MVIGRGLFFAFFDEHGFEGGSIRTSYDDLVGGTRCLDLGAGNRR
jgi:hypothetical protein